MAHLQILPTFLWRHLERTYLSIHDTIKLFVGCKSFSKMFDKDYFHDKFVRSRLHRITVIIRNAADVIDDVQLWIDALSSINGCDTIDAMFNFVCNNQFIVKKDYIILMAGGLYQGGSFYGGTHTGYHMEHDLIGNDITKKYNYKIIGSDDMSNPTTIKLGNPHENLPNAVNYIHFAVPTFLSISNVIFDNTICKVSKFSLYCSMLINDSKLNCTIDKCIFNKSKLSFSGADKCMIINSEFNESCVDFYNHAEVISIVSPAIVLDCIISDCTFNCRSNYCFGITGRFNSIFKSSSLFNIKNNTINNTDIHELISLIKLNTSSLPRIKISDNNFANMTQLSRNGEGLKKMLLDDTNIFDRCGTEMTRHVMHVDNKTSCSIM